MKNNDRVPVAILSCFLIAFVLQGILKISGVFIFEKALDWQVFTLIDTNKFLYIINNFAITTIIVYCLSFTLTSKCYSKKWYHYILICIPTLIVIIIKTFILMPLKIQFICDILLYIIIPLIVYFTTNKQDRLFSENSIFGAVSVISIQILLYFCYLGLCYWSNLLNSLLPIVQTYLSSSTIFLIYFEVYMAQILLMLSCNFMIKRFKNKEKQI